MTPLPTMILELDTATGSSWFAHTMQANDADSRDASRRREDTSAEVLAYEIARYMPELAELLADQGRRKMLAA